MIATRFSSLVSTTRTGSPSNKFVVNMKHIMLLILLSVIILAEGASIYDTSIGTQSKVQFFINKKLLKINKDKVINATEVSDVESVWQRFAFKTEIVIRNVYSCRFMCINDCGYIYSASIPNKECLWTESMPDDIHYSYYYRKTGKRRMYLAINLEGKTRKVVLPEHENIGKFTAQTSVTLYKWDAVDPLDMCNPVVTFTTKLSFKPKNNCQSEVKKRRSSIEITNDIPEPMSTAEVELYDEFMDVDYKSDELALFSNEITAKPTTVYISAALNKNLYSVDTDPEVEVMVMKNEKSTEEKSNVALKAPANDESQTDKLIAELLSKTKNISVNPNSTFIQVNTFTFQNCNFVKT
uniref:FGF n=1 Tax=Buzura suppressaria nuclear polyhedrosis virus TaxID=74320 RepID=A0A0N7CRQ3_NPVBS|nr:FGF [Buzura suppressaria nucleopolyhedrovirus]